MTCGQSVASATIVAVGGGALLERYRACVTSSQDLDWETSGRNKKLCLFIISLRGSHVHVHARVYATRGSFNSSVRG
jgi:hypothetical protein